MLIPLVAVCSRFAGSFGALPLWMTAFGYATEAKTLSLVMREQSEASRKKTISNCDQQRLTESPRGMHTTERKEREYRGRGVNFGKLSEIGNPLPCVAKSWQNQKTSFRKKTGGCFRVLPQFLPSKPYMTCQTHSTKPSLMTGCRGFRGVQSTPLKKENKSVKK